MIRCPLAKFETLAASMPGDAVLPGDTIAYNLWGVGSGCSYCHGH
jgi:hypothetical protein